MRDLKIAYGNSRQAKFWSNKTITFDDLCERLKTPIRTSETSEEYPKLPIHGFIFDDISLWLRKLRILF